MHFTHYTFALHIEEEIQNETSVGKNCSVQPEVTKTLETNTKYSGHHYLA